MKAKKIQQYKMLQVASFLGIKVYKACVKDYYKLNVKASINLLNPSQDEIDQALDTATRDNFECIIIYELQQSMFNKLEPNYVGKV